MLWRGLVSSLKIQIHYLRGRQCTTETQEAGNGHNGRRCAGPRNNRSHTNREYELCQEYHAADDGHVGAESPHLSSQFRFAINIYFELKILRKAERQTREIDVGMSMTN